MKIQLLTCNAKRPDKYAIKKVLEEIADGIDASEAMDLCSYLLDGSPIDIEVSDKKSSSARKSLRKLDIDYEIMD